MVLRRYAAAFLVFIAAFSATTLYVNGEGTQADMMCPVESDTMGYKSGLKYLAKYKDGTKEKVNQYGKPCQDVTNEEVTSGICVKARTCEAKLTDGQKPDQEKPGEFCSKNEANATVCAGGGAGAGGGTQPQPGTGTQTPEPGGADPFEEPKPTTGSQTPQPDGSSVPKPDDASNEPHADPWPFEQPSNTQPSQTNSFNAQLEQAQQSSGFFNTIQNYFNPPNAIGGETGGIGNNFGGSSLMPETSGFNAHTNSGFSGGGQSLYEQAFAPTSPSTGFTSDNLPSGYGDPAPTFADRWENITEAFGNGLDTLRDGAVAAKNGVVDAYEYVADKLTGNDNTDPFAFEDQTKGFDQTPQDLTQEQIDRINNQGLEDRLAEADRQTEEFNNPSNFNERDIPQPTPAVTDPQAAVEADNAYDDALERQDRADYEASQRDPEQSNVRPLDPEVAYKLSEREIAAENRDHAEGALEEQLAKSKAAGDKVNELAEKFEERWAPYRQCSDVCSSADKTYDVRDPAEQAEFKQMQQELNEQIKTANAESEKAKNLFDEYKSYDEQVKSYDNDPRVGNEIARAAASAESQEKAFNAQTNVEMLQDKIANETKQLGDGYGANKDCWGICKTVTTTNFDGSQTTMPLTEYNRMMEQQMSNLQTEAAKMEARSNFFNSDDPLAAQTARTIEEGGYRGYLAEGSLDKMLQEKSLADASRDGQYYSDSESIAREADRRAQLERITSGGELTQLEQDALRKSSPYNLTEAEFNEKMRLDRLGNGTIRSINDAIRLSGPESNLLASEAQSRLFMSDGEVFNQQKAAWGDAALRVGADAANLGLLSTGAAGAVTAVEASLLGSRELVATGISTSIENTAGKGFFAESAAGREAFLEGQVASRSQTIAQMEADLQAGRYGVTESQIAASRAELATYEGRLAEMRGTSGSAPTSISEPVIAQTETRLGESAIAQTETRVGESALVTRTESAAARIETEAVQAARINSEMTAVRVAEKDALPAFQATEAQMQQLTRPLTAAETPVTVAERAAIERYNTAATEYGRMQQLVADGKLMENTPLYQSARNNLSSAQTQFREAGLMERSGLITENQIGADTVYRAQTGEVLGQRANSFISRVEPYKMTSSVAPEARVATVEATPRTSPLQSESLFDRVTQPVREIFGTERVATAPKTTFERPAYDTAPQTFTQTLERSINDFFGLAEQRSLGALTVPEARAIETLNKALAERTLPIPSSATEAGARLITVQRADSVNRAMAALTDAGLNMRADGPIVRGDGEVVAAQLPIQMPGQAPYGVTKPLPLLTTELADSQGSAMPSPIGLDSTGAQTPVPVQIESGLIPAPLAQARLPVALALGVALNTFSPAPFQFLENTFGGQPGNIFSTASLAAPAPSARDVERLGNTKRDLGVVRTGIASWWDTGLNGGLNPSDVNASGSIHNRTDFTVAMLGSAPKYAWGTKLLVRNVQQTLPNGQPNPSYGKEVVVVVASTGSQPNRALDLSPAAADALGFKAYGTAQVEYTVYEVPAPQTIVYKLGRADLRDGAVVSPGTLQTRLAAIRSNPQVAYAEAPIQNPTLASSPAPKQTNVITAALSKGLGSIVKASKTPNDKAVDLYTTLTKGNPEVVGSELAAKLAKAGFENTETYRNVRERAAREIGNSTEASEADLARADTAIRQTINNMNTSQAVADNLAAKKLIPEGSTALKSTDGSYRITTPTGQNYKLAQVAPAKAVPVTLDPNTTYTMGALREMRAPELSRFLDAAQNLQNDRFVTGRVIAANTDVINEFYAKFNSIPKMNGLGRSVAVNRAVGGVEDSDHLSGNATDWKTVGVPPEQVQGMIEILKRKNLGQLVTHVHGQGPHTHIGMDRAATAQELANLKVTQNIPEQFALSTAAGSQIGKTFALSTPTSAKPVQILREPEYVWPATDMPVMMATNAEYRPVVSVTWPQPLINVPEILMQKVAALEATTIPVVVRGQDLPEPPSRLAANPVPKVDRGLDLLEPNPVPVVAVSDIAPVQVPTEVAETPTETSGVPQRVEVAETPTETSGVERPVAVEKTYTYANPIYMKGLVFSALAIRNYMTPTILQKLNDVELGTESLVLTQADLDGIQWARMDKQAYESARYLFGQGGYEVTIPNSMRESGAQIFADGRTNYDIVRLNQVPENPSLASSPAPAPEIETSPDAPVSPPTPGPIDSFGNPTGRKPEVESQANERPMLPNPNADVGATPITDFAVSEIMPDGTIRPLYGDVQVPGQNVPATTGGNGGVPTPPRDDTWFAYGDNLPVPYSGAAISNDRTWWWTIGGIAGITGGLAITGPHTPQSETADNPTPASSDAPAPANAGATPKPGTPVPAVNPHVTVATNLPTKADPHVFPPVPKPTHTTSPDPTKPQTTTAQPKPDTKPVPGPGANVPRDGSGTSVPSGGSVPTGGSIPTSAQSSGGAFNKVMSFLAGMMRGMQGMISPQPTTPTQTTVSGPVSVQVTAQPNPVDRGGSTVVTWSSLNATSCTAFNASSTQVASGPARSGFNVTNVPAPLTITVVCAGQSGQSASGSVQILVK